MQIIYRSLLCLNLFYSLATQALRCPDARKLRQLWNDKSCHAPGCWTDMQTRVSIVLSCCLQGSSSAPLRASTSGSSSGNPITTKHSMRNAGVPPVSLLQATLLTAEQVKVIKETMQQASPARHGLMAARMDDRFVRRRRHGLRSCLLAPKGPGSGTCEGMQPSFQVG